MESLVSVVCLCYNQESFIRQALDGFIMQKTNFPFEIVVHDDASTDRQSQPASATLRNIFEKAFGRSHEIEFLPWPCIYFLSNLGDSPIRDGADVRPFRDILPY